MSCHVPAADRLARNSHRWSVGHAAMPRYGASPGWNLTCRPCGETAVDHLPAATPGRSVLAAGRLVSGAVRSSRRTEVSGAVPSWREPGTHHTNVTRLGFVQDSELNAGAGKLRLHRPVQVRLVPVARVDTVMLIWPGGVLATASFVPSGDSASPVIVYLAVGTRSRLR